MPSLGADMEVGTLIAWRKRVGDAVRRGDIIAEVETEKGIIEVEVFEGGVVEELLVAPGTKVPVGTPLAMIGDGRAASAAPTAPERVEPAAAAPPQAPTAAATTLPCGPPEVAPRTPASPSARQLARERGISLSGLTGTGPHGTICRADVERAAGQRPGAPVVSPAPSPPEPGGEVPREADASSRMRRAIAAAMARSKREIPHYYVGTTIDVEPALAWIEAENATRPPAGRLAISALFAKAVALSLRKVPELNARWEDGRVVLLDHVHLGMAISLRGGGLVAPAIHEADALSVDDLMARLSDIVERARRGQLKSSEMADPTFTVTSLGDRGVEEVTGIIIPPQVGIAGFGKVVQRPWMVGGGVAPRRVVHATLAGDHRVSDGHRGGLFLAHVDKLLQGPETL